MPTFVVRDVMLLLRVNRLDTMLKMEKNKCQRLNIDFHDLPTEDKNKLNYEPGSIIYDKF